MKAFNEFIAEEKNTHMTHVEDLIFIQGVEGTRKAINFLRDLRDMLAGHSTKKTMRTVKYDGCLSPDTKILTNEGIISLEELQKSWWSGKELYVYAHDFNKSEDFFVPIKDVIAIESEKNWVEINFENNKKIKCTEDHKIYTTNRGWVEAKNLQENDDVKDLFL